MKMMESLQRVSDVIYLRNDNSDNSFSNNEVINSQQLSFFFVFSRRCLAIDYFDGESFQIYYNSKINKPLDKFDTFHFH